MLDVFRFVIPVNEPYVFGNGVVNFLPDGFQIIIIHGFGQAAEQHIAPHIRLETVFVRDTDNVCEMFFQNRQQRFVTRAGKILAPAQPPRFVHADIDLFRSKTFVYRFENMLQKQICPLPADQQHVVAVDRLFVFLYPVSYRTEMRQRLNTRNQFYPVAQGVSVDLFQFGFRISAPKIAEIRFAVHFESIFGIQHQTVIPENGEKPDEFFYRFRIFHGVSRTIDHCRQPAQRGLFFQGKVAVVDEKVFYARVNFAVFRIINFGGVSRSFYGKPVVFFNFKKNAAIADL